MAKASKIIVSEDEEIINKIYFIKNQKVMLDRDLATLYNVTTGNLNKAIKRNQNAFRMTSCFNLQKKNLKT